MLNASVLEHLLAWQVNLSVVCECVVVAQQRNEDKMLLFCIYLSPKAPMKIAKAFMAMNLFYYKTKVVPIIVAGDFNIDVLKNENIEFILFMKDVLGFNLVSDPKQSTTLGGSCIDMVFAKNTPDLPTRRFITYFSYHRPLFTLLPIVSILNIWELV